MSDGLPPVLTWRFERFDADTIAAVDSGRDLRNHVPVDAHEIEVDRDRARHVLQEIRDRLDKRSKYYVIEELVLGVEKYVPANVYCQCAYDQSLESVLDVAVTVVPGDLVEPVIPTEQRLKEYLADEDGDGDDG